MKAMKSMSKKKSFSWIVSIVIAFVVLCISLLVPFINKTGTRVFAESSDKSLYTFVTRQSDKITDGKVYVDFGIAMDTDGDKKITVNDAQAMKENSIVAFETATVYVRTRNLSALAEAGEYEALDQTFTLLGKDPFASIAIKVNNGGLQVGDVARQFYVEIYKVEISGVKTGYTFNAPPYGTAVEGQVQGSSRDLLFVGSEFIIDKKDRGQLATLDLTGYSHHIREGTCLDVKENTSFNDIKFDLSSIGGGWYNKIKYLSDHDMVKLGVRVAVAAYEGSNGVYTDNSYVGVQVFAGDSGTVGAPALEGVPSKNVYSNGNAVELARWFAKFQSDERESMELNESYNGKFEGVTVSSYFDKSVYLPHKVAIKEYGQGGIFDADVGNVDSYREGMFLINDLGAAFKGNTTISTRFWKYLSSKEKYYEGQLMLVPTNYRAQVESATLGQLYKDENGKEKIGVSVRFSEPVQFKTTVNGSANVSPYIKGYINNNAVNEITFNYVAGEGTDTLFFEADVSNYTMNITRVALRNAYGFEDVYDFAPYNSSGGITYYGSSVGVYQNLNVMRDGVVNGWDNVSTESLTCSYDLRIPVIDMQNTVVSSTVKTSHTMTVRTAYISEQGNLYYGWASAKDVEPETISVQPIAAQGFQTITSPSNMSGAKWLYLKAISGLGKESEPMWLGPFNFDCEAPILSITPQSFTTYTQRVFDITINNNSIAGFDAYSALKDAKLVVSSDSKGTEVIKTIPIPLENKPGTNGTVTVEGAMLTVNGFTITATDLGLTAGGELEYGTYYLSLSASDELGNQSVSEAKAYYFDSREIFAATLLAEGDFEMDEFKSSGALHNQLKENCYTLDLSKDDLYFKFKSEDTTVTSMAVEGFVNVLSDEDVYPGYMSATSSGGVITVTVANNGFAAGLYRMILADEASDKQSLPIYFYVTKGKTEVKGEDDVNHWYQETTGIYQSIFSTAPFTNKVFQIPTSIQYHYLTSTGEAMTQSYSNSHKPASFSSWATASAYILYREYLDLHAFTLTTAFANDLNSGIRRKAAGVTEQAAAGQVWIRYKEVNWRPTSSSTTSEWVYYYYSEDASSLPININSLSNELQVALTTVAATICSYGEEVDLVTQENLDKYGAPVLLADQMHLDVETSTESMSGTAFASAVEYSGDTGMYHSLSAEAPLSTNTIINFNDNGYLFYKADGVYQPLIKDSRETLGEYINATGRFTILELDEYGAREYYVYIDKEAPRLSLTWETQTGEKSKECTEKDEGITISGNNFYIRDLVDDDTLSFVAIYRYTGQSEGDLLYVYRTADFDGQGISLEDGKYHVYVADRSGNSYTFVLEMKSEALVCSIKEVENSYIRIEVNRSAAEIRYEVYLDGWILTTDFNETRFTESGKYRFVIEDIYGNLYDETYIFERDLPTVTWRYQLADNTYAEYDGDSSVFKIEQKANDEREFVVSTSTYVRFLLKDGCAYEIVSGTPGPSDNLMSGWVTMNNKVPFVMKVYYEAHPDTYVIYTCTVDSTAPQVKVSYEEGYFRSFELDDIQKKFENSEFTVGDNAYTPSFIGFASYADKVTTLYVSNGQRVQSKYFKVQASDENGVKEVKIYLNGELILTKETDFNNIYISHRATYEIVATDCFGNASTFSFTNEFDERVEYFVDEVKMPTDLSFTDYFNGMDYTKVDYGNTKAQIKLLSSAEVHYIITDAKGNAYYFAFVAEDGELYSFQYIVKVVDDDGNMEIEGISSRGAKALSSGEVAKIDKLGVAIYLYKNADGSISLSVQSTDAEQKTYTVETRVSISENESPYYFKTEISNIPSTIEFVDGKDNLLSGSSLIKVNESFKIRNNLDTSIQSVQVAYSATGNYTTYETAYDGTYYNLAFDKEGMYHVKVVNVYGIQTDYYIIISSDFVMTATVEYTDGTTLTYSTDYTMSHDNFYSNKSVEFIVYSTNITVVDKEAGVSVTPSDQGYTLLYINTPGTYTLKVEDEYGNRLEKKVFIQVEALSIAENALTNFNEKALRRDENYTNQAIYLNKNVLLDAGIVFVGIHYNGQTNLVYDQLSEEKTAFDDTQYVGLLDDGEYTLIFRDRYGNKAETVIHYRGMSTLTIMRSTLNSMSEEVYSLAEMQANGVWTNDSVSFTISASEYQLTVDGLENVTSISYDTKTKNEYAVYYLDEYGFEYSFIVYLHREDIVIGPSAAMAVTTISDLLVTKDSVQIEFTENALCTYTLNNETEKVYAAGDILYKDGIYRFKVVDKAGNISTYTVKKDSAVEYRMEGSGAGEVLINGGITNGTSVKFYPENADNVYIKKVFHNNEFIEYDDDTFTERGKWELILADDAGNETYFRFYILYGKLDGFTYYTPYNYEIISVKWAVEETVVDAPQTIKESGLLLEVTENGTYTVTMKSTVTGDIKTFTITIDKTPPQVELVGCQANEKTINNISLKGCSVGDTIYVYRDGELMKTVRITSDYMDPPTINEAGKYRIVVENEAGITTEFSFERKYIPNVAGSVLIIILSLVAVGGLMVGLIWRNHSKTDD